MNNPLRSEKGSYTLETAITFSIIFFVILLLIYMSYVLYEQVRINAIAQATASRGAIVYPFPEKDMFTGRLGSDALKSSNVYWRIVQGLDTSNAERKQKLKDYALLKLNAHAVNATGYPDDAVSIDISNFVFYRTVVVDINVEYKVPLGGIFKYFGISSPYPIRGYAMAVVNEPAEFIRNMDLATDLMDRFKLVQDLEAKYRAGVAKIASWIRE